MPAQLAGHDLKVEFEVFDHQYGFAGEKVSPPAMMWDGILFQSHVGEQGAEFGVPRCPSDGRTQDETDTTVVQHGGRRRQRPCFQADNVLRPVMPALDLFRSGLRGQGGHVLRDEQVVAEAGRRSDIQHRRRPRLFRHRQTEVLEAATNRLAETGAVVDHQGTPLLRQVERSVRIRIDSAKGQGHRKGRALPQTAFDTDMAVENIAVTLDDRQSQPGTAEAPIESAVHLFERRENGGHLVGGNAVTGILNL